MRWRTLAFSVLAGVILAGCIDPLYSAIDQHDTALETSYEAIERIALAGVLKQSECGGLPIGLGQVFLSLSSVGYECPADAGSRFLEGCEQQHRFVETRAVDACVRVIVLTPCPDFEVQYPVAVVTCASVFPIPYLSL